MRVPSACDRTQMTGAALRGVAWGVEQMGRSEPPSAISEAHGMPSRVSAPFVRVFALSTGEDLADELRSLDVDNGTSPARKLLQVAAKLLVPSPWRASIARVVASCAGLMLYTQRGGGREDTLLIIGRGQEIEACGRALSSSDLPTAPLALEMLDQLERVSPRVYHSFTCGERRLDFSVKTGIMGILNVTPDSFYDGGRYLDQQTAVDRASEMAAEGADIIDIGGQSSRPGSHPVSEAEEEARVLPIVEAVAKSVSAIISVDTYRAGVARAALEAGAHLINDISALRFDPALLGVVAERRVPLILMHMQGMPRNMQLNPSYDALIDEVFGFLHERLGAAQAGGIPAEHLLIDPGIGFGKGARHNLELLRKLHHFQALGRPLVIGTSRKSFIGQILGVEVHERLEGTAATVAAAIMQGADIIRVHDVRAMVRVARMLDAMLRPNFDAQA
jgi:dihydropteroate synthase